MKSLNVIYNKIFLIIGYDYVREKVSCILTEIAALTAGHNTGRWLPGGGGLYNGHLASGHREGEYIVMMRLC